VSASQLSLITDAAVVARQPEIDKVVASAERQLVIRSNDDYLQAADYLLAIKALLNDTEADRVRMVAPLLRDQRQINADARAISAPLEEAETAIKTAMDAYIKEQEDLRLEEQRRADEAARKQQQKLQQQATKAIESGKVDKAVDLEQRAAAVVAPVIQRQAPKVTGIVPKKAWKFEVVDPAKVPREYLAVDEKKIGAVVRALRGDTQIAGVRVWSENQIAAGAA
jgi:hypothetical protein